MYLRYLAKYYNNETKKIELGFFAAADYLQKKANLNQADQDKIDKLIYWFDNKLPIPEYYQDEKNRQINKSATSWFKDSAEDFINGMNDLSVILKRNFVEVNRINSKKLLGKVIYKDDFQVTIIPYRDIKKEVS